ncbi:Methyltransferase-like protein 24 [Amphibalanus amphitrite]|uniref:Methyltransferase-like protein 24 n=1 Tax=Amphibalanus amphitrite TaxID=1232801 RepID=A0A6A4W1T0_AMPAM|nr:Methyltransferase-like protein 24 [Amphibalanus amphitrite]
MHRQLRSVIRKTKARSLYAIILFTGVATYLAVSLENTFGGSPSIHRPPAPSAAPFTKGRSSAAQSTSRSDALFTRLQTELESLPAESLCHSQRGLGGRCFNCMINNETVLGQTDGVKPTCLDWLHANCSVLSFGINNDFSFDDQMSDLGCTVHAFDPTMGRDSYRRSERVFFHAEGVAAADGHSGTFPVLSLASAAARAGLETGVIDYLKLDVEGSEWEVLLTAGATLRQVRQLALELHLTHPYGQLTSGVGIQQSEVAPHVSAEGARRFLEALGKLREAGFLMTHSVHSVACQKYAGGCLPFMYETVWVNIALLPTRSQ